MKLEFTPGSTVDMTVELTPKPDEMGVYAAAIQHEGCECEGGHPIGEIHVRGPGKWAYRPGGQTIRAGDAPDEFEFEADGLDGVKAFVLKRISSVEVKGSGGLSGEMMMKHALGVMLGLNSLALKTDSLPGYIHALAEAIAAVVVDDIKAERREAFLADFRKSVADEIEDREERAKQMKAMKGALGALFKSMTPETDAS